MGRVTFRENRCKGCELCKAFCPKGIIVMASRINSMGFHPATVEEEDMNKCTGCAICARMCPDLVIEVEKEEKKVG
ncbi:MAG: tungsten formylmethanofuran dehydrogenase [Peptococcaceae bacterium BRH_c4b]|nr:MAG: tungsten formylmethanofuran dehydrogenase [Peptococcaceae bacterium BRH_c4b]